MAGMMCAETKLFPVFLSPLIVFSEARLEVLNAFARSDNAPSAKDPKLTTRPDLTGYA